MGIDEEQRYCVCVCAHVLVSSFFHILLCTLGGQSMEMVVSYSGELQTNISVGIIVLEIL